MFVWLKVHFENHPLYSVYKKAEQLDRLSRALWIFWTTKPYLVLASPGSMFSASEDIAAEDGWKYFRLCFAAIDEDQLEPITKRLADGVPAFFRIKDKETIEKLLDEDEAAMERRCRSLELVQMMGPC